MAPFNPRGHEVPVGRGLVTLEFGHDRYTTPLDFTVGARDYGVAGN
jgi:hypothetical protein